MDSVQTIQGRIAPYLAQVREMMERTLVSDVEILNRTNDSIIENNGKQLRPTLTILSAMACSGGEVNEDVIRCAAASELMHNATLLHDDVADNSPTRRGAPTTMSILGPRAAVLVGDYWLVKAMDRILETQRYPRTIRLFTKTLSDMAIGEMLQIQKALQADTTYEDYYRIIYCKTASLFQTAALGGALSVGASDALMETIRSYTYALGIAFQIKDDILDYVGGQDLGKPIGQDLDEKKMTLPLLCSLEAASGEEQRRIRGYMKAPVLEADAKAEILSFVKAMDGIALAQKKMDEYVVMGQEALSGLPSSRQKEDLLEVLSFVGTRKY